MRTTNIWAWDNYRGWQIRHHEAPKQAAAYWLNRHRNAMQNAGIERPLLKAQIKMPKSLIVRGDHVPAMR